MKETVDSLMLLSLGFLLGGLWVNGDGIFNPLAIFLFIIVDCIILIIVENYDKSVHGKDGQR